MEDASILNWLDGIDEEELRKEREAEIIRKRQEEWNNCPQEEKDRINKMVVAHAHKYGLIYKTGKRCYCNKCHKKKDWLDEYYGEAGDW